MSENKRIYLGNKPYAVSGFADFIQEFSGDRDSARLLTFTARVTEPDTVNDDFENYVADDKATNYAVGIRGDRQLLVGGAAQLSAFFIVRGKEVASTAEYPIEWRWESNNDRVCTVEDGLVIGVAEGEAIITATMAQNDKLKVNVGITVSEYSHLHFVGLVPYSIQQYNTATITAALVGGDPVVWTLKGAPKTAYSYSVSDDTSTMSIWCNKPSAKPLIITAKSGGEEISTTLFLEGY